MNIGLQYGGVTNLTAMQVLRRIQKDTGILVRAERTEIREDTLSKVVANGTCVKMIFTVREYRRTRQGRILTSEGLRAVVLTRVVDTWSTLMDTENLAESSASVEEVYRGRVESPDETMERVAHEEMCHRRGSSRFPMMNAAREEQFKRGGL